MYSFPLNGPIIQGMFQVCERKVQINSQSFICIFSRNRGILERKKERKEKKRKKENKSLGISADSMQTGNKAGTLNNNAASIEFERNVRKRTVSYVRPTKTKIRLREVNFKVIRKND